MIYLPTTLIATELENAGLNFQVQETGALSYVEAAFTGSNGTYVIRAISSSDEPDVKIMSADFAKIPENKRDRGYALVNALNIKYKYAKFCIDEEGDLCVQCDLPAALSTAEVGTVARELMLRFPRIIDDAYPDIMRIIWS